MGYGACIGTNVADRLPLLQIGTCGYRIGKIEVILNKEEQRIVLLMNY